MASTDRPDDLHDAALAEDIALLGDMMAAAAADRGRELTEAEVDEALGLPSQGLSQGTTTEPTGTPPRRRRGTRRRADRARKP